MLTIAFARAAGDTVPELAIATRVVADSAATVASSTVLRTIRFISSLLRRELNLRHAL
jgi:hypothetical protein